MLLAMTLRLLDRKTATKVFRLKHIHIVVIAGLVSAIHVFASNRSARRGCVDARIRSGRDELAGIVHDLNGSKTRSVLRPAAPAGGVVGEAQPVEKRQPQEPAAGEHPFERWRAL